MRRNIFFLWSKIFPLQKQRALIIFLQPINCHCISLNLQQRQLEMDSLHVILLSRTLPAQRTTRLWPFACNLISQCSTTATSMVTKTPCTLTPTVSSTANVPSLVPSTSSSAMPRSSSRTASSLCASQWTTSRTLWPHRAARSRARPVALWSTTALSQLTRHSSPCATRSRLTSAAHGRSTPAPSTSSLSLTTWSTHRAGSLGSAPSGLILASTPSLTTAGLDPTSASVPNGRVLRPSPTLMHSSSPSSTLSRAANGSLRRVCHSSRVCFLKPRPAGSTN